MPKKATGGFADTFVLDIQTLTASGTWTKPANAKRVTVFVQAPGGGGSSGGRQPSGTVSRGGNPGGYGGFASVTYMADELPASVPCSIGSAGIGGASVTTDGTPGTSGTSGGSASFGNNANTQSYYVSVSGGLGATATAVGSAGQSLDVTGPNATTSVAVGGTGGLTTNNWSHAQPGGPAAGHGITPASANGGSTYNARYGGQAKFGNALGVGSTKTDATTATAPVPGNYGASGSGGPGGWCNADGTAGPGAAGFRGGGGGGGGASLNGNPSGKGGDGGGGVIVVVTECFA